MKNIILLIALSVLPTLMVHAQSDSEGTRFNTLNVRVDSFCLDSTKSAPTDADKICLTQADQLFSELIQQITLAKSKEEKGERAESISHSTAQDVSNTVMMILKVVDARRMSNIQP